MSIKSIANAVGRRVSRQALVAQKHSPKLLFAAGVIGIGATVVLACRATLKVEPVLDKIQDDVKKVDETLANQTPGYTERDHQKGLAVAYAKGVFELGKLYGPAILTFAGSVACLTGAQNILNNRLTGMTAAFTAADKAFKAYRKRVVEEYGEEKDRELRFGSAEQEYLVETDQGPEVVKRKHVVGAPEGLSQYAVRFGRDTSKDWSPQPEYNLLFLRAAQNYANERLQSRGHVFLNDILDHLGIDRIPSGQAVGWIKENPKGGDNFIDFGIWGDDAMERLHDFMTGREGSIWLDPNVDGSIWDQI